MDGLFVHLPLEEDIQAISGHYQIHKELCIEVQGRSLLYLLGVAAYDRTCCGQGGCLFALVAGFLRRYRYTTSLESASGAKVEASGRFEASSAEKVETSGLSGVAQTEISEVEWIVEPALRKEISELLKKKHPFVQVQFATPSGYRCGTSSGS